MMSSPDANMKTMLDWALEYRALGYPIFPVCTPLMGQHKHRNRSGVYVECPPDKRGKTPLVPWRDCQEEVPSEEEVRSWWRRFPNANIGMATGRLSGRVVLDCDSGEARQLCLGMGGLDKTQAVWTGTPGGCHFWLATPEQELRNFVKDIPGTDFRGEGGYVLLPPSRHWKGANYRWVENSRHLEPAPVPDWLMQLFEEKTKGTAGTPGEWSGEALNVEEMLRGFTQGHRDNGIFRLACRFRHDDMPQAMAEALIRETARNCDPPFDEVEAVEKVRYVYGKYEAGSAGAEFEDDGWFAPPGAVPTPPPEPVPSVWFRPISELLAMPEVEPDWMVNDLFTVASNGWVAAEPKVGKSWVVLELAYALSTGMPFLGRFAVKQPRRVLYVQEEDSLLRVLRRLKKIIKGDPMRPPPADDFWRWSIRAGFKLDSLEWLEKLRQEIIAFNAEVVILDVFNRLHGSDENKQPEMTAILNNLTRLTNDYGCAFIIVHHNRKPQSGNEARANQSMRGHSVLAGWAECSLYLKRSKEKDTIIVTPESKDAPEMEDFTVVLADQDNGGIVLEVGDAPTKTEQLSKGDEAVIEAVQSLTDRGIGATARAVADLLGKDRSTVQARLTRLTKNGYLTAEPISSSHNPTMIYRVVSQ